MMTAKQIKAQTRDKLSRAIIPLILGGAFVAGPLWALDPVTTTDTTTTTTTTDPALGDMLNDYDKVQRELYQFSHGCATPGDDSQLLRDALATQNHIVIPAGVELQVGNVELVSGKRISGPGKICKRSDLPTALLVTGTDVSLDNIEFMPRFSQGQPNCDIKLGDGAANVRIRNNRFVGGAGPYAAICGANNTFTGGGEYAKHATGILVSENFISGYSRPIYLHSIDNITIRGNMIRDTIRDAIRIRENSGYAIINANQFINIGRDPESGETQDAVDTYWSGQKLVISDNIVRGTASIGFDVKGAAQYGSAGSHNIIIANNQISGTRYSAINFHGDFLSGQPTNSLLIEGNILTGNSTSAILGNAVIWVKGAARYVNIADNQITSNTNRGITVQSHLGLFNGSVQGVQIVGNTVVNNGIPGQVSSIGINVQAVDGLILSNNVVANDLSLPNPEQKFGIFVTPKETAQRAVIRNNTTRCNTLSNLLTIGYQLPAQNNKVIMQGCD